MGHGKLRIVTHLDYKEVMHTVLETLEETGFSLKNSGLKF
jgi:threonine aldolase